MNEQTCINCETKFDSDKTASILRNINQTIAESLPKGLCLDCIRQNLGNESGSAYIKVKEMQKAHEQAKLAYQSAYNEWKASISQYESIDHSLALIKHLIAQENKPQIVRKTSTKKLT